MASDLLDLTNEMISQNSIAAYQKLRDCLGFKVDLSGKPVAEVPHQENIINMLQTQARNGHAMCQALMGSIYLFAWCNIDHNIPKALELAKRSAGLEDSMGEVLLGVIYLSGYGVSIDHERALRWYRMAEAKNNPYALNNIGSMYEQGFGGLKIDATSAFRYFRASAEQDNSYGIYNIGRCYENGVGVSQDYAAALTWYKRSAEKGNRFAQFSLAKMLHKGIGTNPHLEEAIKWYVYAARSPKPEFKHMREEVEQLRREGHGELIDKIEQDLNL